MTSKIFFRAGSGNDYELTVLHDPEDYVPKFISEGDDGWIQDLSTDKGWSSLPEMTQDLKIEIIGCESEAGN